MVSRYDGLPQAAPALTAGDTSLYIILPAPPAAKTAIVSGTANITLRGPGEDTDHTFTPSSAIVGGGSCIVSGAISPARARNGSFAAWFNSGSMTISWR